MVTSPIEQFQADRARAREAGDPMAAVCVLATADEHGHPEARTLVLRQVEEDLALFMNSSSPKWQQLQQGGSINTYWPSIEIQYRMRFTTQLIDPAVVAASWQYRPDTPKRMDWFYQLQQAASHTPVGRHTCGSDSQNANSLNRLHRPYTRAPLARFKTLSGCIFGINSRRL